ncbi:MAG: sorbosone dehydrogenase, partial [Pseudomonadota bacterium]
MARTKLTKIASCMAALALSASASADLGVFATSGKTMNDHTFIEQGGQKAENIKKILQNIKMPEGFKIDLYALVPDARDMAMA